jgi:hypothetical protein
VAAGPKKTAPSERKVIMSYEGDRMLFCPATPFDFSHTYAVLVTGWGPNYCGHLILYLGGRSGMYIHVAGELYTYPRQMTEAGYHRYLQENGKRELGRFPVVITDPTAAMLKLEQLMSAKWFWGVLPHNCASFVEEIVQAGGSTFGLYSNCPTFLYFN